MHQNAFTRFFRAKNRSNPVRSPSFRSSQSDPFWPDAFATDSLSGIIAFYHSPQNSSGSSRSLVARSTLHVVRFSPTISQSIHVTCYERFRPNNSSPHSGRWCYRGCWHQSCPPLIRIVFYTIQKPMETMSTRDSLITLSCIVKVSRLLHPVGLGPVSQCPSRGYLSQGPYGSKVW